MQTNHIVGTGLSTGLSTPTKNKKYREKCISIPRFSASLDCRKQGSCQILVEQSSWQEEIRKIYKWNTMYQTTFQNN
jgi:hypothetical protein